MFRLVGILANELIELQALDPLHLECRKPEAANANAFGKELEADRERQAGGLELRVDLQIAFAKSGRRPGEAL